MLKKDMAKEIKKYQGRIFYYDQEKRQILPATWIQSLDDYNHYECELHHVVPYTDWELNTKNVREIVGENALILLRRIMHHHLENPIHKLTKEEFESVYGIHPDLILYDINSKIERTYPHLFLNNSNNQAGQSLNLPDDFLLTDEDLSCFDDIYESEVA